MATNWRKLNWAKVGISLFVLTYGVLLYLGISRGFKSPVDFFYFLLGDLIITIMIMFLIIGLVGLIGVFEPFFPLVKKYKEWLFK